MFFFNVPRYVLIFVSDVAKETYRIELNKGFFTEIHNQFSRNINAELLILYFFYYIIKLFSNQLKNLE